MRLWRPFLIVIMATLLCGCVPNAVTYYQPTVDGGILREAHCVPTKSLMDFTVTGGRADAQKSLPLSAFANNGSHVHQVALFLSPGAWQQFRFVSVDFRIYDRAKKVSLVPKAVRTFSDKGMSPLTTEPYVRQGGRPPISEIQVTLEDLLPDDFDLLVPPIVIDGEEVEFPVIHFERKVWMGISPFNC